MRKELEIKLAGGAVAQLLGLISALKVEKEFGRKCKLTYFPISTGTFWPFAINFLLDNSMRIVHRPAELTTDNLEIGQTVPDSQVFNRRNLVENLRDFIYRNNLQSLMRSLKLEHAINGDVERLFQIGAFTKSISGSYPAIYDESIFQKLHQKFLSNKITSPFQLVDDSSCTNATVIHFRLGDQRVSKQMQKVGLGVPISPKSFMLILTKYGLETSKVYVMSEEPDMAVALLKEEGMNAVPLPTVYREGGVWSEIAFAANAASFIGSWSQVSQFISAIRLSRGKKTFLPNRPFLGESYPINHLNAVTFDPIFLPFEHPFYSSNLHEIGSVHEKTYKQ